MTTQKQRVLDLLIERGETGVSAREAIYDLRITRLAAIIFDLKQDGYAIKSETPKGETARYTLLKPTKKAEWRPCQCGHPYRQHVSGSRCMAHIKETVNSVEYCPCYTYTEGNVA